MRAAPAANPRWIFPEVNAEEARQLARNAGLPLIVAELLLARGIRTTEQAERFFAPSIGDLLDPYSMRGMSLAVQRLEHAIAAREPVLIYGDYDVDGTTAVVLLKTALEMRGGAACYHVPHRLREGYGMQREVLETAARAGVRLVISVDTGIRAYAAAEAAAELGLDLIVTDHHLPEPGRALPEALAVLNPNQPGCHYACKHLCGAGVAFKLSEALLTASTMDKQRLRTKTLPSFLKMLAIATVADAVPLLGENRVFVALGLAGLSQPASSGLRALMRVAQLDPAQRALTATHIGFRLGPRINAAGRMDVASDVVELFTTRDAGRAQQLAEKLDRLNSARRQTEAAVLEAILRAIGEEPYRSARLIAIDGEGWHRGVIGILASRIVDQAGKPAIVMAHEDGEAYGSGRSVTGFHLLEAIESCHELFTRFGGHAHAVGFSLPSSRVPELKARLAAYAATALAEDWGGPPVACAAELPLDHITPALHTWLQRLEPCGMGNTEPVFTASQVRLVAEPRYIKDQHVRLQLAQGARGAGYAALGWRWADRVRAMHPEPGQLLNLAYKLRENVHPEWGGLELEIVDLQRA